nr:ATP-dependent DNA helicase [Lysinibacter cavernae]
MTTTAYEIADAIGKPPPTAEQVLVIESDPHTPSLVIAGAGSGKTETMANRVLWLVANGHAQPSDILGLTFTRKAAGELAERITQRLDQLADVGLAQRRSDDLLDQPTVSTYNSFASSIVSERSLLVGREPNSVIIDESTAWRLARSIVASSDDERLIGIDKGVNRITDLVLHLERSLRENVRSTEDVSAVVHDFERLLDLPISEKPGKKTPYAALVTAVRDVGALSPLLDLVERYSSEKRRRGFMEFSDQVALALEICRRSPSTVSDYRARYKYVLLDEYQDTSVVQTWLLSTLFSQQSVMAVGDPHQSIYGWRGASADNLDQFARQFAGGTCKTLSLLTSWRNAKRVLDAANRVVGPLSNAAASDQASEQAVVADAPGASAQDVQLLGPRPGAPDGTVSAYMAETITEEAAFLADWMAEQLATATTENPITAAVICRNRSTMPLFAEALTARGVPNRILGLGGLLSSSEVIDIVSMLRCIWFTDAGSALIRILTSPRWRLGVSDLAALHSAARWLSAHGGIGQQPLSDEQNEAKRHSLAPEDSVSLIDALDSVQDAPDNHPMLRGFSDAGLSRARDAARTIAAIRTRSSLGIADLVRIIEKELRLDLEVLAVTGYRKQTQQSVREALIHARRNLDALYDLIAHFLAVDEEGTLASFLAWIEHAEQQDSMAARPEAPDPNAVQLITAHGSKGLEWDVVAVPRLVEGEFPAASRTGDGWLRLGQLPDELKGDANSLPQLDWRNAETQQEFIESLAAYKQESKDHRGYEERRLMYVAVTRARDALLLTGSFWAGQTKPKGPSPFLLELADAGMIAALPEQSEYDENPIDPHSSADLWPADPLGARRPVVEAAAAAVVNQLRDAELRHSALNDGQQRDDGGQPVDDDIRARIPDNLLTDIDLLLAERAANQRRNTDLELPDRITASRFKDFVTGSQEVANSMRRPVPQKPFTQTRLGTQFHAWVEERYATPRGTADTLDASVFELDEEADENGSIVMGAEPNANRGSVAETSAFEQLKATFEASPWGGREPHEVEREIHIRFAGRTLICKIDAVYSSMIDGEEHFDVVDWKTGKVPRTDQERADRQLQLALYRIAYAEWKGVPTDRVSVALYYVGADTIIRPESLPGRAELEAMWIDAVTAPNSGWKRE